jgi:hypothetical protein
MISASSPSAGSFRSKSVTILSKVCFSLLLEI